MGLSISWGRCSRIVLLTITCSACVSIIVFVSLQIASGENNSKTENPKGNLFQSEKLTDEECIPVCDSRSCVKQAEMLLRSIKPTADPCENFSAFLCGSYGEKFDRNENGEVLSDMTKSIRNNLKNILENIKAEPGSASAKMKIMYDSCVNTESDLNGLGTFRQTLNNIGILNWPHLVQDFKLNDTGLSILLGVLRSYGRVKFFAFGCQSKDEDDQRQNEVYAKVFFRNLENKTAFIPRDAGEDVLKYFEIEPDDVEVILNDHEYVASFLLNFIEEAKQHMLECEENCPDVHINCTNPEDDDWKYLCVTVQAYLNSTDLKQYVTTNDILVAADAVYFAKNAIPRLKTVSDRSLANYFALDLLWHNLGELNFFFRLKKQKHYKYFKTYVQSKMKISFKWKYCVNWMVHNMNAALENEYVKSSLALPEVDEIHDFHLNYTSAVAEMISQQDWIPILAKAALKNHVKSLECNMEFIKRHLPNDTYFNEFYKTFNPTPISFFRNVLDHTKSMMNAETRFNIGLSRRPEPYFIANAETDKDQNINFQFGILMPPVYYPGHLKFVNQILFAPIVVHEIGHNLVFILDELSKTSEKIKKSFIERKQCMENQFSKFKFKILDENLNGTKYLDENLSDNLASSVVDKIIKKVGLSEEVFLLPGLTYSPEQLFFMSSRQIFCATINRSEEERHKLVEKHAPMEHRIIGTMQNSKEYSQTFGCPEGSYMNPAEKCTFLDTFS